MSIPQTGQREEIRDAAAREELSDKLYSFAELDRYTFKQRLIIRFAGVALYWIVRAIGATLKFEVKAGRITPTASRWSTVSGTTVFRSRLISGAIAASS